MSKLAIAVLMAFLAGCSSPKDANDKNFKAAIQGYLDVAYPKCYFKQNLPIQLDEGDLFMKRKYGNGNLLFALVDGGYISQKGVVKETRYTTGWGNAKVKDNLQVFDLTEKGKPLYKQNLKVMDEGEQNGFCFGKAKIKEIKQFSEPSEMLGAKISQVSYTYSIEDIPDWARLPKVQSASNDIKKAIESETTPLEGKATLVLTNNGWVHDKLFKQ